MTYEYKCQVCGYEFTQSHRTGEAPRETWCDQCWWRLARLQVSGGQGFMLKGPRWAKDGYSGKGGEKC